VRIAELGFVPKRGAAKGTKSKGRIPVSWNFGPNLSASYQLMHAPLKAPFLHQGRVK
jgi:hypothetical protein